MFLSYNSADRDQVEAVANRLRGVGLSVWFDRWELTSGGQWQEELATGLRAAKSCAVFVGPAGVGDWSRMELMHALDLAAKGDLLRVFPVLLPGVAEPFDSASLPPFMSSHSWVDLRGGWSRAEEVQVLVNAVHGVAGATPDVVVEDALCPYVGLRAFEADDALWYVGREGDVQRLVESLRHHALVAVLGPSGSGKSSLVRAGLLPALAAGELVGSADWRLVTLTPGARPIELLAAALAHQFPQQQPTVLADGLRSDPRTLDLTVEAGMQSSPFDRRIVWVVDQFEELFTLCQDDADRRRFVENLLHATAPGTTRNVVVLTMRSDFDGACATMPELARALEARQFLVSELQAADLRRIVEVPARLADLELEAGLSQTILRDVADEPGRLPLLQHALLETPDASAKSDADP